MIEFLSNLDTQIFLFFNNGFRSDFLDSALRLFSGKMVWVPMYAAVLVLFLRPQRWRTAVVLTVACVAAIALSDQVCATLIRPYVARLRPSNPDNPLSELTCIVNGYRAGSYSFPSCHAANSFALATFLCLLVRKRGFMTFILLWAAINSYSRVYLGVHYPGDLLVGGLIGAGFGALCYYAAMAVSRKHGWIDREELLNPYFSIPLYAARKPVMEVQALPIGAYSIVVALGLATTIGIVLVSVL